MLFLIIFIVASCRKSDDYYLRMLKNELYPVLLKKWQESDDWQEQGLIDSAMRMTYMCSSDVYGVVRETIRKYYNFEINDSTAYYNPITIEYSAMGEQKEHWLVRIVRSKQEIWVLISRTNRNVLSMTSRKFNVHYHSYMSLLYALESSSIGQQQQRFNYSKDINEDIDSVTAVTIAVAAAMEYYGFEMLPLMANLMGFYNEHWVVYCFPVVPPFTATFFTSTVDTISRSGQGFCYNQALSKFIHDDPDMGPTSCPKVVMVLILRKNGQVLSMREETR
jgi:uncharacterized membrane protein YbaN (DUF454 family)